MNDRTSFVFYFEWSEVLKDYPAEVRLEVYDAIIRYAQSGTLSDLKPQANMAFAFIKKQIDQELQKTRIGQYHWNWKGGITEENHRLRNSSKYKEWRHSVFCRDKFTCQQCGHLGGILHAHHIIPFSVDKSTRLDIDNGVTLCKSCHINLHKTERIWTKK